MFRLSPPNNKIETERDSGMVEAEADDNQHWVRRSVRAAGASALEYPHVAKLLEQIRYCTRNLPCVYQTTAHMSAYVLIEIMDKNMTVVRVIR